MSSRHLLLHVLLFGIVQAGLAQAASPDINTVGISAPLTGDLAVYGNAVRNGVELARANSPLSRNIRFIYEDNRYDPATAIAAYRKLRERDGASVIYQWGELPLASVAPIAEREHAPLIAMSIDAAPAIGARYIIRSINDPQQIALKVLEYLRSQNHKRIAIITAADPFIDALVGGMRSQISSSEVFDVVGGLLATEKDFKSLIVKLRDAKYDAVGVYLLPGQVSAFYRQASALKLKTFTFGTDVFESSEEIAEARGAMTGAVFPAVDVPAEFSRAYRARYGNETEISYAYNAYVFALRTMELAGNPAAFDNPEVILSGYFTDRDVLGYRARQSGEAGRFLEFPMVLRRISGAAFERAG